MGIGAEISSIVFTIRSAIPLPRNVSDSPAESVPARVEAPSSIHFPMDVVAILSLNYASFSPISSSQTGAIKDLQVIKKGTGVCRM